MEPSASEVCTAGGRLMCLHGSVCNESTGVCDGCAGGFANDNVVFLGNFNCGMPIIYMAVIYSISAAFAAYVSFLALRVAREKHSRSRLKRLLFLTSFWNGCIPLYLLAHYLHGFRHGPAAAALFMFITMMANVQVGVFGYTLWKFMAIICGVWTERFIFRTSLYWFALSISMKLGTGVTMIVAASGNDVELFNRAQIVSMVFLFVEITVNVYIGYHNSSRMVDTMTKLQSDSKVTSLSPVVVEFIDKVKKTRNIQPIFAAFFLMVVIAAIALYARFGGAIPYQFILWTFPVILWPLIGLAPALRAKSNLARHLDGEDGITNNLTSDPSRRHDQLVVTPGDLPQAQTNLVNKTPTLTPSVTA